MTTRKRATHRAVRGFTLAEMMVATALAGVIAAAAVTATVSIVRTITGLEQSAEADNEAKILTDYITTEVLQTGGGSVRPWQAISNSCADPATGMPSCSPALNDDRLHVIVADDDFNACTINAWDGSGTTATITAPGGVCCLDAFGGVPRDVVLLPSVTGGGWQVKTCAPSSSPCACTLSDVPNAVNLGPASGVTVDATSWIGGTVAVLNAAETYYLDAAHHTLWERVLNNNSHAARDIEMSDRVYDFQVQFGYDDSPVDGHLDPGWLDTLDPTKAVNVRMTRIGVVVGVNAPAKDGGSTAQLFGGFTFTASHGILYRATYGAVALRNVLVFY